MSGIEVNKDTVNSITFDSDEEKYFSWWVLELIDKGYIYKCEYQVTYDLLPPAKFTYSQRKKTKSVEKSVHILNDVQYTVDFIIHWNIKAKHLFYINQYEEADKTTVFLCVEPNISYIDTKGTFAGKKNNSAITFPLKQKIIYFLNNKFIQKIVPIKLFSVTFVPLRYLTTDKSGKSRKINIKSIKILQEFIK